MAIRVDYVIQDIRNNTDNEDFDEVVGYADEEILRFINDAQNRIHAKIIAQHASAFNEEYSLSTTSGTESYTMPYNIFLDNKIAMVEWSHSGLSDDYVKLTKVSHTLRTSGADGHPTDYSIKGNKIYLSPVPNLSSGTLRISFIRKPKQLNKRRGTVIATSECVDSTTAPTYVRINYPNSSTIDPAELERNTRFSIVDKYGQLKMTNLILSSIGAAGTTPDLTTYDAQLNIDSSTVFNSGDSIAQGDYIVPGPYATTHLDVDETVERYIRTYAEYKVLARDSSIDAKASLAELDAIEKEILASYADQSEDVYKIPEINTWWI